jgi:hypothetical protein
MSAVALLGVPRCRPPRRSPGALPRAIAIFFYFSSSSIDILAVCEDAREAIDAGDVRAVCGIEHGAQRCASFTFAAMEIPVSAAFFFVSP